MLRNFNQLLGQKGSLMVEALAMLGLISMVTPVLYKKAAERTTELQDINTASQLRTMSKAVDDYIKDHYHGINNGQTITMANLEKYLPLGYTNQSKVFKDFKIKVYKDGSGDNATYTGIVVGDLLAAGSLPPMRSAKIASMVGANGGVVNGSNIDGVQGGWQATTGEFGLSGIETGSVAATSVHAVTSSGVNMDDVLYRNKIMGDDLYNTMATNLMMGGGANLLMGSNDIRQVKNMIAASNDINVTAASGDANLKVTGTGMFSKTLAVGATSLAGAVLGVDTNLITARKKVLIEAGGLEVKQDGAKITGDSSIASDNTIANIKTTGVELKQGSDSTANINATGVELKKGANSIAVNVAGAKMAYGTTNSIAVNATETAITGPASVSGLLKANKGLDVTGDGVLIGKLVSPDAHPTAGSLYVQNNATVRGTLYVNNIDALNIHAQNNLTGGGGNATEANFKADRNRVTIAKADFNVGGSALVVAGAATSINTAAINLNATGGTITATAGSFNANTTNTNISATDSIRLNAGAGKTITLNASTSGEIVATSDNFTANKTDTTIKGTGLTKIIAGNVLTDAKNLVIGNNADASGAKGAWGRAQAGTPKEVTENGVIIRREGMIILPATTMANDKVLAAGNGDQDKVGYVKLDRIIGNQVMHDPYKSSATPPGGSDYDAYQVNPAYTSVMHDIKLTTRGGARLSDILPDFINKGIYVIDNTYTETSVKDWSATGFGQGTGAASCGSDLDCVASPWLGFVPTPQCPPEYAKVITISPIRWKMAEAYAIGETPVDKTNLKALLRSNYNPYAAKFELEEIDGSTGVHTHGVTKGFPLTFQTNTWLNTTISALYDNPTAKTGFKGWHAIMGFLYHGSDYQEYLTTIGAPNPGNLAGKIVWNIFPVYNQEITAIADVYCYFERRDANWNKALVDTGYDQMTNMRTGSDKKGAFGVPGDTSYQDRLNDPALKYKEIW